MYVCMYVCEYTWTPATVLTRSDSFSIRGMEPNSVGKRSNCGAIQVRQAWKLARNVFIHHAINDRGRCQGAQQPQLALAHASLGLGLAQRQKRTGASYLVTAQMQRFGTLRSGPASTTCPGLSWLALACPGTLSSNANANANAHSTSGPTANMTPVAVDACSTCYTNYGAFTQHNNSASRKAKYHVYNWGSYACL